VLEESLGEVPVQPDTVLAAFDCRPNLGGKTAKFLGFPKDGRQVEQDLLALWIQPEGLFGVSEGRGGVAAGARN
jgi:hypothetical protein